MITAVNIQLMIVGALLILSGPVIVYRTWKGFQRKKTSDPNAKFQILGEGFNYLIGVVFFFWGILFVINNLKGNPLA